MKYRNGFVSNSSSCSFVLVGQRFTLDEFYDKFGFIEQREVDNWLKKNVEDLNWIMGGLDEFEEINEDELIIGYMFDFDSESGLPEDKPMNAAEIKGKLWDQINTYGFEERTLTVFPGMREC